MLCWGGVAWVDLGCEVVWRRVQVLWFLFGRVCWVVEVVGGGGVPLY